MERQLQTEGVVYYRRDGETMLGECVVYLEVFGNYVVRQVDDYGYLKLWADVQGSSDDRIMLADQPVNLMGFELEHEISAEEFERTWREAHSAHG